MLSPLVRGVDGALARASASVLVRTVREAYVAMRTAALASLLGLSTSACNAVMVRVLSTT